MKKSTNVQDCNYGDCKAHCVYSPELDATFEEPENFIKKWDEYILEYINIPLDIYGYI